MDDRPLGISILALLAFFVGLIGLCLPIGLLIRSGFADYGLGEDVFGVDARAVLFTSSLLLFISPLLYLAFSYGALGLKSWAWWLGLLAPILALLGRGLNLSNDDSAVPTSIIAIFDIIVLIYLLTPKVRHAFGIGRKSNAVASS